MKSRDEFKSWFNYLPAIQFEEAALSLFRYQSKHVQIYKDYLNQLKINPEAVKSLSDIPFLPIRFFKSHKVLSDDIVADLYFESSGTTSSVNSRHYFTNVEWYHQQSWKGFNQFFDKPEQYNILALLPSYAERSNSSLISMVKFFMEQNSLVQHGFYLNDEKKLIDDLGNLSANGKQILLIGVSFALLQLAENFATPLLNTLILETGGMKGRRKEITRFELHAILKNSFQVKNIYSEYGMTELFSQAWATSDGIFQPTRLMKVLAREINDPFKILPPNESGTLNIIDLANVDSCAFIATDDSGVVKEDGTFEVTGRIDESDLRGCNLMF